jgi:hypothetical protein
MLTSDIPFKAEAGRKEIGSFGDSACRIGHSRPHAGSGNVEILQPVRSQRHCRGCALADPILPLASK